MENTTVIIPIERYNKLIEKEKAINERNVYVERFHYSFTEGIEYKYGDDFNLKMDEIKKEYIERYEIVNKSRKELNDKLFKIHNMNIFQFLKWKRVDLF